MARTIPRKAVLDSCIDTPSTPGQDSLRGVAQLIAQRGRSRRSRRWGEMPRSATTPEVAPCLASAFAPGDLQLNPECRSARKCQALAERVVDMSFAQDSRSAVPSPYYFVLTAAPAKYRTNRR